MKVLFGAISVSLAVLSNAFGGRHSHAHGPMHAYHDCTKTAGLSDDTITKMKDSIRTAMKDMDPKNFKEKFDPSKQAEDVKALVKQAEPDKAEAFDSCLLAAEDKFLNRSPFIACANSTGVSPESIVKMKEAVHNAKAETDMRKRNRQIYDDARRAVSETDSDKLESYNKCLVDRTAKFNNMRHKFNQKGHAGARGEEKTDEEAKPEEER